MAPKKKKKITLFQSEENKNKRRQRVPKYEPGDYIVVRYPNTYSWGRFSHRMLYILKRYKAANAKGKQINRYTYLVIDFYKKARRGEAYRASFADHTQNTFRTNLRGGSWQPLTEVEMDLEFIVKFGGPNDIARRVIDEQRRNYQSRIDNIKNLLHKTESAMSILEDRVSDFNQIKEREKEDNEPKTKGCISLTDFDNKES